MRRIFHVSEFTSQQIQTVRNVKIHSPSIIQIISGKKSLLNLGNTHSISQSNLLLCKPSATLSFQNIPTTKKFKSRLFSFFITPTDEQLSLNQEKIAPKNQSQPISHIVPLTDVCHDMLSAIATLAQDNISAESKIYWVKGLFQYLAEQGQLHLLFPTKHLSLTQQVSEYLAQAPANDHQIEQTALHFNMSRATFIRKLNQENKKFREILMEVRLNHALNIIQHQKITNIAMIAQACGYLSDVKFSQRFKEKFGLSIKHYIGTVYEE